MCLGGLTPGWKDICDAGPHRQDDKGVLIVLHGWTVTFECDQAESMVPRTGFYRDTGDWEQTESKMKAWCLGIVFLMSVGVAARAQDDSAVVTSKIVAMEKAWNQAFKLRDARPLMAYLLTISSSSMTMAACRPRLISSI